MMKKLLYTLLLSPLFLFGQENYSLDFSDGNYGRIPITETLAGFETFTMECWYYETGHSGGDERIVGIEGANQSSGIHLSRNNNSWSYGLADNNGTSIGHGNIGSVIQNEWVHLAVSYDDFTIRFFINGQLIHSEDGDLDLIGNSLYDIVINRHTWNNGSSSSSRLDGQIDELRISNIARYTDSFTAPNWQFESDENTVGLWHFNNDFNDYSGNENHGTQDGIVYSENTPILIIGCTDASAFNYDETASLDDGTCISEICLSDDLPSNIVAGLAHFYPFCENTNDVINSIDGIVYGAELTLDRFGNENSAYSFDGDDYIELSNTFYQGAEMNELSYNVWFNIAELPSSGSYKISGKESFWKAIWLSVNSFGKISFQGSSSSTYFGVVSQENAFSLGEWHMVSVTLLDGILKLYIDGQIVTENECEASLLQYQFHAAGNSTATNYIGAIHPVSTGVTDFFVGELDEFMLWDRALSEDEIMGLYSHTGCMDETMSNFNIGANSDDGSCYPVIEGCLDATAFNYVIPSGDVQLDINSDDGSCHPVIEGCMNPIAENYIPQIGDEQIDVNTNDGSCLFSAQVFDNLTITNSNLEEDLSVFETVEQEQDYSMSFDGEDGTQFIDLPAQMISHQDPRTIMVKVNPENNNYLFSSFNSSTGEYRLETHQFALKGSDSQWYYSGVSESDEDAMVEHLNDWLLVTGVWDNENIYFYHDSILIQQTTLSGDLITGTFNGETVIGQSGAHYNSFLTGEIDYSAIWNKALTHEEIQSYMSCPPTGQEEGLVGYWNFNEGSGDTVYDLSGNGNHGVIYGAEFSEDVPSSYDGCTDENALNFNVSALCDNGSCVFGDDVVSNLEDSFNQTVSGLNNELDSTNSTLNNVLDTWQSSIDLTTSTLDEVSLINQTLSSFNSVIDLSEGWNMIGYGCPEAIDVSEGLAFYTDLVLICKDNNGSVYLPEFGFNGIVDFTPGYGYQLKISESIEGFSLCGEFTNIDNSQITDIETDNAQMQNHINCLTGNPQVGDYCYGGIVFYVAEVEGTLGKYGLVAASEDLEGTYEWGCSDISLAGANDIIIGSGYQNTLDIISENCQTVNGSITSALTAIEFENDGYSDWYLPSKEELIEMGLIEGFSDSYYWSSSEYSETTVYESTLAIQINVLDGSDNGEWKYSFSKVRPIRSFGDWTEGCMDSLACNFNTEANMSDGSCEFADEGYDCDGNELQISMSFDGVFDNVQTNNSNSIDVNHSISIGFSIKPNTWNTGDENCIVSKKSSDNSNGFVVYNDANTTPRITLRLKGSLTEFPGGIDLTSNSPVDIDEWQSWFFVYDTTTSIAKIYKNGILDTTYYSINNVGDMSNSSDLYFGLPQHPSWNGFYDGLLYDVSIWEVALDQFQIQSFFNCSLNGNEEGLVGYWKFNEGEGSIVNDSSGNGNHGTINGASYSTDIPVHNCE